MSEIERPKKRWFRFSLATFLFVSLCIGGSIGGYQSGFRWGYQSGRDTRYDETQIVETYDTLNVIWPDLPVDERIAATNELKDLICSTVAPEIWEDGNGNEIREFPEASVLAISAPGRVQREIRGLFAQLERLKGRGIGEQLIPVLQSLAAQNKTYENVVSGAIPKNSQLAQAWVEKHFQLTVDGISERWGRPRYQGACSDKHYPNWSLDQRIATWQRGDGIVYLALRYLDDGKLHMMAGFRGGS